MIRIAIASALAAAVLTPTFAYSPASESSTSTTVAELKLCKHCPVFVGVPTPRVGTRDIRFVAKFELTWNNYLAAVDSGSCQIPKPYRFGLDAERLASSNDTVARNIDKYRVDWPIGILGEADVQCYVLWLQKQTHYKVALPSADEWEWFARAGNLGASFPWGNDPDPRHEALLGTRVAREDEVAIPEILDTHAKPGGVRVGLFPPNKWGIHDLMGNLRELTSDIVSGVDWLRRHPDSVLARNTRDKDRVLLKGSDRYAADWKAGIAGESYAMVWNGRYSTDVAVRLVLSN